MPTCSPWQIEFVETKKLDIISKYFVPKEVMLDLGAGTCIGAKYFDVKVVSVDSSAKMLKRGIGKRVVAKAEKLPFKENTFSSMLSLTAIHHFNVDLAIKEIKRVVKKDSHLAITLLKKSKDFKAIKKKILHSFKVKEYDCVNDIAFIGKV